VEKLEGSEDLVDDDLIEGRRSMEIALKGKLKNSKLFAKVSYE